MTRARLGQGRLGSLGVLPSNAFGLSEALVGYLVGFVVAEVLLVSFDALAHRHVVVGYPVEVTGLVGIWTGFAFALALGARHAEAIGSVRARLTRCYGMSLRAIDIPLGVVAGLVGQYLVVPLVEAPLLPFVPHLYSRLSGPARSITSGVSGAGLVVLCLLVCVGTPLFEELFFRGLLLRGLLGAVRRHLRLSPNAATVVAVLGSALVFGLAHFELLELPGLIGAGIVFGTLAAATRRLGAGMVAHATFNAVTILSLLRAR